MPSTQPARPPVNPVSPPHGRQIVPILQFGWKLIAVCPAKVVSYVALSLLSQFLVPVLIALILAQMFTILQSVHGPKPAAGHSHLSLSMLFIMWGALSIASPGITVLLRGTTAAMDGQMRVHIRRYLFERILCQPPEFYRSNDPGRLSVIMDRTGVEAQMALRNLLVDPLIQVVGICSAAAAIISQLRDIHLPGARWIITGIALIFGALPAWFITRKSQVIVRESQANLQRFRFELGTLVNGVAGAPDEIQAMDAQRIFSSKYKDSVERFRKAEVKQSLVMEGVNSALQVPGVFATVLLLGLVVRQWYHGAGTELVAASIVLVQLLPRVMEPFRTLASLGILANVSWPAIATVLAVQDPPRPQRPESAQLVEKVSGTLEARNVRFAYDPQSKPVFDGLSFSALPGGITGLVARMGQGKTTFFRLVLRLYDPQSGEILLGGVPAQDLAPATVRQHVGMMSQNPAFFFDSVEENLRVASPTSTTEQITRLCQHTGLGPILENALGPDPLHRPFAAGAQLSGGQKKLFALTRCLLRDPKILLLDEPTTGMDNLEKFPLIEMMRTACAAKTVIVVDHDIPWLVKFCDHFVVLDAGRVVQQGTVQQLLEEGGLFKELHDKARQGCA